MACPKLTLLWFRHCYLSPDYWFVKPSQLILRFFQFFFLYLLFVLNKLPAVTSKSVTSTPLDLVVFAIPLKLATSAGIWLAAQWTIDTYADGHWSLFLCISNRNRYNFLLLFFLLVGSVPGYSFFLPLVTLMLLNEIAGTLIFISLMSFFSKVSDPTIGGSYMTLLNTLTNLGGKWTTSLRYTLLIHSYIAITDSCNIDSL